jgi:hypothetical protein
MQGLARVLEYIVADKPPQEELILMLNELGYVLCSFAMAWVLHTVIGSAGTDLKNPHMSRMFSLHILLSHECRYLLTVLLSYLFYVLTKLLGIVFTLWIF